MFKRSVFGQVHSRDGAEILIVGRWQELRLQHLQRVISLSSISCFLLPLARILHSLFSWKGGKKSKLSEGARDTNHKVLPIWMSRTCLIVDCAFCIFNAFLMQKALISPQCGLRCCARTSRKKSLGPLHHCLTCFPIRNGPEDLFFLVAVASSLLTGETVN